MLNSYNPGHHTSIFPKRHYKNIVSKKNSQWITWLDIEKPISDLLFEKINGTIVNKQKHLLQISVRDLQNYMILPIFQGGFFGAITVDGKLCIGDNSLRMYIPKYRKPTSNRNKIKCVCKTCISAMLIQ